MLTCGSFRLNPAIFSFGLQEEFSLNDECKFEEGVDYHLSVDIGTGAYGKCYLATVQGVDTKEERVVCVKKVRPKSIEKSAP